MPETIETPKPIYVDNPRPNDVKTKEEQAEIDLLLSYHAIINDEAPQWFKLKGAKGKEAQNWYRPTNCFPSQELNDIKEVPRYWVEQRHKDGNIGGFHMKCADFVAQFEKSDSPPSTKK